MAFRDTLVIGNLSLGTYLKEVYRHKLTDP